VVPRRPRGYAATVRGAVAVLLLLAALTAGATPASARVYRGVMTNGAGAVRSGEQGALWQSRFVEHKRGRVRFSACVIFRDARGVVLCKAGRTNRHGVSRLSFSEFVNLRPGHWVVRFFKLGRTLSAWRFTVRSEGV
jgi:hypothetical protein